MYIRELIVHVYFTQSTNFTILYTIKKMCSTSSLFCFRILTVIYNGDKNINAVEKKL